MKEQHQKDLLKRILRYSRKNYTESFGRYALLLSGGGRREPANKEFAKAEAWGQMVRYMEGIMRELDKAIEIYESLVEMEQDMEANDV